MYNKLWLGIQALFLSINPFSILILDFGLFIIFHMIDTECSSQDLSSIEIVDSKCSGTLIFIHEKSKASSLAGFLIARKIHVHDLTIPSSID